MNILLIESYYTGSHKQWIDSYGKYSNHNIQILSLPGKKWKWRMHGGAVTLAKKYEAKKHKCKGCMREKILIRIVWKNLQTQ